MSLMNNKLLISSITLTMAMSSVFAGGHQERTKPTQLVGRAEVAGSLLPALKTSTMVSKAQPNEPVSFTVGLEPRFPAELQAFADSVSDPKSPNYRNFMTPQQVGEAFGADAADVAGLENFFRSKGMHIDLVCPNHMAISVTGTVAQVESAFGTTVNYYTGKDPLGKTITFRASSSSLKVPSSYAAKITSIDGLETYTRP